MSASTLTNYCPHCNKLCTWNREDAFKTDRECFSCRRERLCDTIVTNAEGKFVDSFYGMTAREWVDVGQCPYWFPPGALDQGGHR